MFHPYCCHRGASLEFAIVSDRGLRCAYHGWLFDVDGTVLETPGEPPDSTLKENLFQGAYPAHDIKGLIHAYLGPPDLRPHLPHYDMFDVPGAKFAPFSTPFPNNWLQSHENNIDPVHAVFLHQRITEQFVKPFSVLPTPGLGALQQWRRPVLYRGAPAGRRHRLDPNPPGPRAGRQLRAVNLGPRRGTALLPARALHAVHGAPWTTSTTSSTAGGSTARNNFLSGLKVRDEGARTC